MRRVSVYKGCQAEDVLLMLNPTSVRINSAVNLLHIWALMLRKNGTRLESYGPKFVENCVQGIARDLLMYSMQTLSQYFIVGHIHDEMIIECPKDTKLDEICQQMREHQTGQRDCCFGQTDMNAAFTKRTEEDSICFTSKKI